MRHPPCILRSFTKRILRNTERAVRMSRLSTDPTYPWWQRSLSIPRWEIYSPTCTRQELARAIYI